MSGYNSSKRSVHTMKGKGERSSPPSTKAPKLTPKTRGGQAPTSGNTSPGSSGGSGQQAGPQVWS